MKCLDFNFNCKSGEEFNITPLFDLHEEARDCAHELIEQRIDERNQLPNHYIFMGGDVMNCIMPKDMKRYKVSTAATEIAARDDYLNATLEYEMDKWAKHKDRILAIGKGNHEQKAVEYHGYDITRELCRKLGVPTAGYSGALRFRFNMQNSRRHFNIAWHHGAWGGQVIHGFGGAERFFFKFRYPWDAALFGHNHHSDVRWYDLIDFSQRGKMLFTPTAIVCCGTYLKTFGGGDEPDYAEQAGYPPVHLGSPLINIKVLGKADKHTGQTVRWKVVSE